MENKKATESWNISKVSWIVLLNMFLYKLKQGKRSKKKLGFINIIYKQDT